jgi:phosphoribosylaminoimidazole-succinocarboxamide synthase
MQKGKELYVGKAKSVYECDISDRYILYFRNDTSAFDGKKLAQLENKGMVNNKFNAFIMEKLEAEGVPTHFDRILSEQESLVKKMVMLPVECVVRNIAAGSICRRYGIEEGRVLEPPTFEFFLKSDALGDPLINESHITSFGWATQEQVQQMKTLSLKVNEILKQLFLDAGMLLVDYKLEFGEFNGQVTLGDEFSPDGCRIWDRASGEKLDKDRFRQDLGKVIESYQEVGRRLGLVF